MICLILIRRWLRFAERFNKEIFWNLNKDLGFRTLEVSQSPHNLIGHFKISLTFYC